MNKTIFTLLLGISPSLIGMEINPELRLIGLLKNGKRTAASTKRIQELIDSPGINLNHKIYNTPLLLWTIENGRADVAMLLVARGANVNGYRTEYDYMNKCDKRVRPLAAALKKEHKELSILLISKKAFIGPEEIRLAATKLPSIYGHLFKYCGGLSARFAPCNNTLLIEAASHGSVGACKEVIKCIINSRAAAKTFMLCLNRMSKTNRNLREIVRQGAQLLKPHVLKAIVPYNQSVLLTQLQLRNNQNKCPNDFATYSTSYYRQDSDAMLRPDNIESTTALFLHKELGGSAG